MVGPQHLGHEHGEPVLVPDEQRLVAAPAADPAQHRAPGRELVALVQSPRSAAAARGSHGGGAATVVSLTRRRSANFELSAPTGWSDGCTTRNPSGAPSASTTVAAAAGEHARERALRRRGVVVGEGEEGVGEWRGHRRRGAVGVGPCLPQIAPLDNPVSRDVNSS